MAFAKTEKNDKTKEPVKYEVLKECGIIGERKNGKEVIRLRYMKWGDNDPRYDIRAWKEDGQGYKIGTFTGEEMENLYEILKKEAEAE